MPESNEDNQNRDADGKIIHSDYEKQKYLEWALKGCVSDLNEIGGDSAD